MQSSDCEKMDRAGLLKRLLNVFRCFVPNAQYDSTDETFYLGRVAQATALRVWDPYARRLCRTQDWIASAVANQRAVFRITSEEHSTDIMACEVSVHVEFAGVSWRRDWLGGSKEF